MTSLKRENRGNALIIGLVAILFILTFTYALRQSFILKPIKVSKFSINPSSVKEGDKAIITINVKNLDLKTNEIKLIFSAGPRVSIYAGEEQLLLKSNNNYLYSFKMKAEDPTEERVFSVSVTLEEGISKADYHLSLTVYVDGEKMKKTWGDLILTVKK